MKDHSILRAVPDFRHANGQFSDAGLDHPFRVVAVSHHRSLLLQIPDSHPGLKKLFHFRFHGNLQKSPGFLSKELCQWIASCFWTFLPLCRIFSQGALLRCSLADLVLVVIPFQQSAPLLAILSHTLTSIIPWELINLDRVGRIWDVNRIHPTDFLDIFGHDQAPVPEQKPRKYRVLCYL